VEIVLGELGTEKGIAGCDLRGVIFSTSANL
jgi:hypothetical protein